MPSKRTTGLLSGPANTRLKVDTALALGDPFSRGRDVDASEVGDEGLLDERAGTNAVQTLGDPDAPMTAKTSPTSCVFMSLFLAFLEGKTRWREGDNKEEREGEGGEFQLEREHRGACFPLFGSSRQAPHQTPYQLRPKREEEHRRKIKGVTT